MTTQNCADCGTPAEPGQSFCDACGAVLGWDRSGRRAATRPAASSAAAASSDVSASSAPAATAGTAEDVSDDVPHLPQQRRPHDAEPPSDAVPASSDARESEEDDTDEIPRITDADEPAPSGAGDTVSASDRARSLLVPVAEPDAPAAAPPPEAAPVLPGRPVADRPQVRTPGPNPDTGFGPPCPWCSTPNRPDRHYCARCAMPLSEDGSDTPEYRPWWRRLFGGRRNETPWAGERPRLRRVFDSIGTWIGAAVALTLVILAVLYVPDGIQATRDHFAKRSPVSPDEISASRSWDKHPPELLIDKLNNTWWGPGVELSGQGEWIEVGFNQPTRLLDLVITPGVSTKANQLKESALPHRIKAVATLRDGKTVTKAIVLDQGAGPQRRAFRVGEAVKVRFTLESAHAAAKNKQVAIAEIEFFGPSSANS